MLAIDIQKKSDGKHIVSWEVDSLDRILDELGVYEGVCTSCYGKAKGIIYLITQMVRTFSLAVSLLD